MKRSHRLNAWRWETARKAAERQAAEQNSVAVCARNTDADIPIARLTFEQLNQIGEKLLPGRPVCPDCRGTGMVNREDGSDRIVRAMCLECQGFGFYREAE